LHRFRDVHLFPKTLKKSRDSEHKPFGGNACTSTPEYQSEMKFEVPSFTNFKDMIGAKLKNGSRDPYHAQ